MGELYEIFDEGDDPIDRFEVRDLRVKTRFAVDNVFYDEFTPLFGPTLSMVYIALVRHANKEQKTWPSQSRVAAQLGLTRQWVGNQLQVLELFNLIRKVRIGKMCTNRYYLIDEKHWRRDFEDMRDRLSQLIAALEKKKGGKGEKVMSTEFTSNRKDTQSKDKQRRKGIFSVKRTIRKIEAPKQIHVGEGNKVETVFDPEQNAIVYRHFN